MPAPIGCVEPHASLLSIPADGQLLFKVMTVENLVRSIKGGYLHFNRVDSYADFEEADKHDGQQLPEDEPGNRQSKFHSDPMFSAADYYDRSRIRTYACCFSLENSSYIWEAYGTGGSHGKVCLVFSFGNLRARLNETIGASALMAGGHRYRQILSINYGNVEYVDWHEHRLNSKRLPNPIRYTYLKSRRFQEEKEHRVSLSALGIGDYVSTKNGPVEFPVTLPFPFGFRAAAADETLRQCLYSKDCDEAFLNFQLKSLGFLPSNGTENAD